ncbi:tRNA (guanosine(46)-N7)-methyltransferase TrmB [Ferrovum sp. PN-J185]|uniref:tRNA (guanosine(46)-N7)-methyltransferase TrmB n=1 Tax=Ferrovum sp. PN-J185 TaxID=1356306 RepID=UPI00079B1D63|nr:tRNA (guanosine(46)-N7)-methyltransferase TrmB [Ferrovum sp. PN-J185]KXW56013.1 tRNA (guanine-N(7)-)-methyltransferase [Ferrovum sp. PN-J185]MCC6068275.1 tRNA (guanosine(46)-N7)-methyltransferase TrmB [Ferrovum sp. PN-J185]MDE1892290.1 tRNA (guanosine(46)-N7)-methyltransferase TrmB [Betaproteobacteria bacterium]MDE2056664.1 tRNA (guanosine(46)-N7)-methyltransferase TrmB [Betaproteobacteria bacterium]
MNTMTIGQHIRSYVLRQGRLSTGQQRAIDELFPQWGIQFTQDKGLLSLHEVFNREAPTILEIGFGMGEPTINIAKTFPEKNFIAVDVHGPGIGNILKLIDQENLTNVRIIRHDAVEVLQFLIPPQSLAGVHIFFPDPWPKARHHKRRLIQSSFINNLVNYIQNGGYIHLATDWQDYADQMLEVLSQCTQLKNTTSGFAVRPDYRPLTKFENRGLKLGHGVWDLLFIKESK